MTDGAHHRWSTKRPAIRFLFLTPAMFGGLFPSFVRLLHRAPDQRLLTVLTAAAVTAVVGYGLLVWKIVIEAHRHSGVGALFGEER